MKATITPTAIPAPAYGTTSEALGPVGAIDPSPVFGNVLGSTDGPDAAAPFAVASVAPPMIADEAGGRPFSATDADPGGRVDATICTGATATDTGF